MPSRPRSRGRGAARATGRFAQSIALLVSFVLVAGIGGVLLAGLALPGVALANGAANMSQAAFDDLPTELNFTELPQKSVILAADGTVLATFFDENRVIVPLEEIAPIMQKAVIAVEDKRFYEHSGIDPQGMLRALAKGVFSDETQGASTLTQQYIKNVLLQAAQTIEDPVEREVAMRAATVNKGSEGYARKLREAKLAITLEKRMSKDEILHAYLNIAQFGRKSIYGVEAAAQYFFGKHASELNYIEAATIAGVTQSPSALDPEHAPAAAQGRRNVVLGLMRDQGYITPEEYEVGVRTPLADTMNVTEIRQGCMVAAEKVAGSGFFCDYVTKILLNDPVFGADRSERARLLYRGGLTITTTLIPGEQTIAYNEVLAGVPRDDPSGVGSAIVVVEPGTGKVTAMAQNRDYTALADAQPGQTSVNWNTTNEYGSASGFAPGSTFKPFTLLEWLKQGHSLTETFDGTLRALDEADFTACGAPYGPHKRWTPGNAEGAGGIMDAINATKKSVNSAYFAMAQQLDLCNIMQGAADLGVKQAGGFAGTENVAAKPSNVIGADSVAPLSMAAAFAAFASGGTYCKPIAITRIVDTEGIDLPIPSADCQQKIETRIAAAMNYTLQNVWTGTASNLGKTSYASAGKTGTTSYNEQIWFVGYTPLRSAAVWVGHPEGFYSMHGQKINGKAYTSRGSGPYGSDIPAPTWRRFMDQVMAGAAVPEFAPPGNKEIYGDRVQVPDVTGLMQDAAIAKLAEAGFQSKVARDQATDYRPAGTVVAQSPTGKVSRGSVITLTVSNGQGAPPEPPVQPEQPELSAGAQGQDRGHPGWSPVPRNDN
jgi:membrane peptidoglycan carboxypeptidase